MSRIMVILMLINSITCLQIYTQQQDVSVKYLVDCDSIQIDYFEWSKPLMIHSGHNYSSAYYSRSPVFIIDSSAFWLYILIPANELAIFDLNNKEKIDGKIFDYHINESKFDLEITNNKIIFSSNKRLWILNKCLTLKESVIDTLIKQDENLIDNLFDWNYKIVADTLKFTAYKIKWIQEGNKLNPVKDDGYPIYYNTLLK